MYAAYYALDALNIQPIIKLQKCKTPKNLNACGLFIIYITSS